MIGKQRKQKVKLASNSFSLLCHTFMLLQMICPNWSGEMLDFLTADPMFHVSRQNETRIQNKMK